MKFYNNYSNEKDFDYKTVRIFNSARRKILLYKFGANEKYLDRYFKVNNNITLRLLCIRILFESRFMTDFNGRLVIDTGRKWDKYARFITFGDGVISGSKILIDALSK